MSGPVPTADLGKSNSKKFFLVKQQDKQAATEISKSANKSNENIVQDLNPNESSEQSTQNVKDVEILNFLNRKHQIQAMVHQTLVPPSEKIKGEPLKEPQVVISSSLDRRTLKVNASAQNTNEILIGCSRKPDSFSSVGESTEELEKSNKNFGDTVNLKKIESDQRPNKILIEQKKIKSKEEFKKTPVPKIFAPEETSNEIDLNFQNHKLSNELKSPEMKYGKEISDDLEEPSKYMEKNEIETQSEKGASLEKIDSDEHEQTEISPATKTEEAGKNDSNKIPASKLPSIIVNDLWE